MTGGPVEAAVRGETRIADRVVAKIAAQAAHEALRGERKGGAPPRATVTVNEERARVRISVELVYPSDIGRQCGAVRHQVAQRVKALAGMEVPEVAVRVERLHSDPAHAGQGRTR